MSIHLTPVIASELAKTILVSNYFYRVRMEAIRALTNVSPAVSFIVLTLSVFDRRMRVHWCFPLDKASRDFEARSRCTLLAPREF